MFTEAIESILVDRCTPAAIRQIENGGSPAALWGALAESGFLELMASEEDGGAGLDLAAIFPIFVAFGRHALPVPAAQTIAARALLRGVAVPEGMITLAGHGRRNAEGDFVAANLAFGGMAEFALADIDSHLVLLDTRLAERTPSGVQGSLATTLRWSREVIGQPLGDNGAEVGIFSAALHAAAIAGAMERLFGMTLSYCNDRVQFGKPIGKFQAVQHMLAVLAGHVAAASAVADMAVQASAAQAHDFAVAVAKARTGEAAGKGAEIAHQVHGAMGFTHEHSLHHSTRRLWSWREEFGNESFWQERLGRTVAAAGAQALWPMITSL